MKIKEKRENEVIYLLDDDEEFDEVDVINKASKDLKINPHTNIPVIAEIGNELKVKFIEKTPVNQAVTLQAQKLNEALMYSMEMLVTLEKFYGPEKAEELYKNALKELEINDDTNPILLDVLDVISSSVSDFSVIEEFEEKSIKKELLYEMNISDIFTILPHISKESRPRLYKLFNQHILGLICEEKDELKIDCLMLEFCGVRYYGEKNDFKLLGELL